MYVLVLAAWVPNPQNASISLFLLRGILETLLLSELLLGPKVLPWAILGTLWERRKVITITTTVVIDKKVSIIAKLRKASRRQIRPRPFTSRPDLVF